MPTAQHPQSPVSARAVAILAAGVARLLGGGGGVGELSESSGDRLEPGEHGAISVPGGERGARGVELPGEAA